jgi:hypothetical protein
VRVAVCSTSNERAVQAIVDVLLGAEVSKQMRVFAGDMVPAKKPDPAIYLLAARELGVDPARWVFEGFEPYILMRRQNSSQLLVRRQLSGTRKGSGAHCLSKHPSGRCSRDVPQGLRLQRPAKVPSAASQLERVTAENCYWTSQ